MIRREHDPIVGALNGLTLAAVVFWPPILAAIAWLLR